MSEQWTMVGGPHDGKVKVNDNPDAPLHDNERVRFTDAGRSAVYHLNPDGTATWIR